MESDNKTPAYEVIGFRNKEMIFRTVIVAETIFGAVDYAKSKFNSRNCEIVEVTEMPTPKRNNEA